jgi:Zn-dependent protease
MKTWMSLISIMIFGFLGVGSLFAAPTETGQGVAPALTGSRVAVTGGPADGALAKVGGPDRFVELAQNPGPRAPKLTGQTGTKKKALGPRTNVPPPAPTHG